MLGEDEIELGLGIHGELGVRRGPLESADTLVERLLDAILIDLASAPQSRAVLLVNNLGVTPLMELAIAAWRAVTALKARDLKRLLQPVALATVLAGGFVAVWSVLTMWAAEVAAYTLGGTAPVHKLVFLRDGTPLVVVHEPDDQRHQEYRDLAGNAVPQSEIDPTGWLHGTALPAAADVATRADEASWGARVRSFADG